MKLDIKRVLDKTKNIPLIAVAIGITVACYLWSGTTELTEQGRIGLTIASFMASLWITEAVPIAVTALLPLVLFPLFNIMPSKEVSLHYGNHLIFLYLGGFMIAVAMEKWNLHKRMALNIVLAVGTKPTRLVLGFMAATAFLSMWISNTATTMMMFPIALAVIAQVVSGCSSEEKTQKEFACGLMLAIAYAASIGGVTTLIGTPPNVVMVGFVQRAYPEIVSLSFFAWMKMVLPFSILFLGITWLVITKGYFGQSFAALNKKPIQNSVIQNQLQSMGKMSREEKWIALVFLSTALLWIFRKPINIGDMTIPGWSQLFDPEHRKFLHDTTVAIFMGLLLFFIPSKGPEGQEKQGRFQSILGWEEFKKRVPWGVLILFGGGFALAAGLKETGVAAWIAQSLSGLQEVPVFVLILTVCLAVTFLTEITSNLATTTVLLPILGPAAVAMGLHPFVLVVPATISASCAFMLPVATPPNAIVYSSGCIPISQMARVGFILNLIGIVLVTLLVYFFSGSMLNFQM